MYKIEITEGQKENDKGLASSFDTEFFDMMIWSQILIERYRTFEYQSEPSVEPSTGDIILGFVEGHPNLGVIGTVKSRTDNYGYTDFEVDPFLAKGPIEDHLNPNDNGMIWLSDFEIHEILKKG